jgi:HlyD family secretion protein
MSCVDLEGTLNGRLLGMGLGALAILTVATVVYVRGRAPKPVDYSGTVETREIQVGSKVGGRVTVVAVEEGQTVRRGALLVRFESNDLQAQRTEAEAAIGQARANLDKMQRGNRPEEIAQAEAIAVAQQAALEEARNGPRPQDIAQARADLAAAEADALNAETTYTRMEKLVATDTISRMEFDSDRDKRDFAAQKAESARQKLAELEAGTRREDVQAAEARYRQAEAAAQLSRKGFRSEDIDAAREQLTAAAAKVADLDVSLSEAELTAPADGVIEVVGIRPGDLVAAGRIVVSMLEASQLWVKVYVPETDLSRVHVGQLAAVMVDGMSRRFHGHVGQIASEAEFLPRNVQTPDDREHQVFGVKVYVEDAGGMLKSGMSATVHLE